VNGDAYAGGMGLLSACDIAIAADSAHFCLSETRLGLLPATISPYVIRAMGERAANRYFLTAERFDAATALRLGLLHDVVPAEALHDAADAICRTLCANGPDAVQASKRLVRDFAGQPIDTALIADTVERIAACRSTDEAREGVAAFLEKREPSWRLAS